MKVVWCCCCVHPSDDDDDAARGKDRENDNNRMNVGDPPHIHSQGQAGVQNPQQVYGGGGFVRGAGTMGDCVPYTHVDSNLRALAGQAEGFGRFSIGGMHGSLYCVTSLAGIFGYYATVLCIVSAGLVYWAIDIKAQTVTRILDDRWGGPSKPKQVPIGT
eukprot:Gb_05621 [translate_table: standard]